MPAIKKTICIVEDKADLREVMGLMIGMSDKYELGGSYANGRSIKTNTDLKPAAVLMDINLPGMSGIRCVNALKTSTGDVIPDLYGLRRQ